jgi:GATA-binding protein
MAAMSPVSKMNPTSTEHDFRFPRRPTGRDSQQRIRKPDNLGRKDSIGDGDFRSSLRELNAGIHGAYVSAGSALLGPAQFPLFDSSDDASNGTLGKANQDEPLASQLWKAFVQCKQHMPHQRRMENMTWRLMSLQMRQHSQEKQKQKYVVTMMPLPNTWPPGFCCSASHHGVICVLGIGVCGLGQIPDACGQMHLHGMALEWMVG